MKKFLKSYREIFEEREETEGQPLFDEWPEAIKKDMTKFVKFLNKNVLQQVKSKINSLNFERRDGDITLVRSTDIISSQLGLIALFADSASILLKMKVDNVRKEAQGTMYICFNDQELAVASLKLKNGQMLYATAADGDYVAIEKSDFAIGLSSTMIEGK